MTDMNDDESVGYGKPPKATRFQKGRSGNPSGRPKRTRTQLDLLRRELAQRVTLTEGGRKRRLTKGELVAKQLVTRAMKGEVAALRMMLRVNELMDAEMTRETEAEISEKDRLAADQAVFDAIAAMVAAPKAE